MNEQVEIQFLTLRRENGSFWIGGVYQDGERFQAGPFHHQDDATRVINAIINIGKEG